MDEQIRRERRIREQKRKRKRRKRMILRFEIGFMFIFALALGAVVAREFKTAKKDIPVVNEQVVVNNEMENENKIEENETSLIETSHLNEQQEFKTEDKENLEEEISNQNENDDVDVTGEFDEEGVIGIEGDESGEVELVFAGDICFHDEYSNMGVYVQKGSDIERCIGSELLEMMRNADVFMVNNEFTYTDRGTPTEGKTYAFRSKPENVKILSDMGVDIVSLANNHVYDYGEVSLLDTLDTLEKAGVPYVGAGRNLEEASKSVVFKKNGIKVALLSATQIERLDTPDTKGATENAAGTFRCWGNKIEDLKNAILEAKQKADYVVVYVHWGTENTDVLDWAQLEQAKEIAEAGADLIVGDHPHCLQQFAKVNGVPVIYSLGNYWFNSKTVDTGLLKVSFNKKGITKYQFVPAIQMNCTTNIAEGVEKERILEYMRGISPGVIIDEEGNVGF